MKKKDKILFFCCFIMIVLTLAISGCNDFKYAKYEVTEKPYVDQTSVELYLGDDDELASIQLNSSPADRNYTWTSQNTEVATVTQTGFVRAIGEGYTNIIVTSEDDLFTVIVHVQQWIPVESIMLDVETVDKLWYGVKDRFKINALFEPPNTTERDLIEWSTSDPGIATVTQEGWVTYSNAGKVVITAKAKSTEKSVLLTIIRPPVYDVSDPEFIDRSNWKFPGWRNTTDGQAGYSSQDNDGPSGEVGGVEYPGGTVYSMIDGNSNSFWHARWHSPESDYPHWFIIDLGEHIELGGFMIQNRQGDGRSGTGLQFYTTDIDVNDINDLGEASIWTSIGRYTYNTGDRPQCFSIMPPYPTARFIKAYFGPEYKNGDYRYIMIAEFGLFKPKEYKEADDE